MAKGVASTSVKAFHGMGTRRLTLRDLILSLIEDFGRDGCIADDIRALPAVAGNRDSSLTGRYTELEQARLMFRNGDTRPGVSGLPQLVMRHHKFAEDLGWVWLDAPLDAKPEELLAFKTAKAIYKITTVEEARAARAQILALTVPLIRQYRQRKDKAK